MQQNKLLLPVSIVIAGALIGGALFFSGKNGGDVAKNPSSPQEQVAGDFTKFQPVSSEDHILGNPQSPIKIVEYADPQCHFCKSFHPTMKKVMSEYGQDGKVAWVYRHFSILGPTSDTESEATECAAELGGNEKFFEFIDLLFESKTERGNFAEGKSLETVAEKVGLDVNQFNECLQSGKHKSKIAESRDGAVAVGGRGTPYSLLVNSDNEVIAAINGAQTFENVKAEIEKALAEN